MDRKYTIEVSDKDMNQIVKLCGPNDKHLDVIREAFTCQLTLRDNQFVILCEQEDTINKIKEVLQALFDMMDQHIDLSEQDVDYCCRLAKLGKIKEIGNTYQQPVGKTINGKMIYPKTIGQRQLLQAMRHAEIVFATGVAGTGKTYLAVVYAANLLKKGEIKKIILTRPAVEAGENLGFLPGDLKEKVDPYLRPLYDALYDTLGNEQVEKLLEKEVIEIAPLAYMRGRTLDNAFIILDEAQNTTRAQMKMFLTRMGFHSRIVITGDVTQIDLIKKRDSGLLNAKQLLYGIEGISFVELTSLDVVRHPLVQKIIERYEKEEEGYGEDFINRR
ncbi:PhoH family protein [[Eubacterium] hominis]|uniref:PhoH family protein n=1 Tax=[Eubacterium] hominis TaxID=2764325 RepID=UPI0022DF4620